MRGARTGAVDGRIVAAVHDELARAAEEHVGESRHDVGGDAELAVAE